MESDGVKGDADKAPEFARDNLRAGDQDTGSSDQDTSSGDQDTDTGDQDTGTGAGQVSRVFATEESPERQETRNLLVGFPDEQDETHSQEQGDANNDLHRSTAACADGDGDIQLLEASQTVIDISGDRIKGVRDSMEDVTTDDGSEGVTGIMGDMTTDAENEAVTDIMGDMTPDAGREEVTGNTGYMTTDAGSEAVTDIMGDITPDAGSEEVTGIMGDFTSDAGSEATADIMGDTTTEAGSGHKSSVGKPDATESREEDTAKDAKEQLKADELQHEDPDSVQCDQKNTRPDNKDVDSARKAATERLTVSDTAHNVVAQAKDASEQLGGWTDSDILSDEEDVDEDALENLCKWVDSGKRFSLEAAQRVPDADREVVKSMHTQWGADLLGQCDPDTSDADYDDDDNDDVGSRLREVADTLQRASFMEDFRSELASGQRRGPSADDHTPDAGQHGPGEVVRGEDAGKVSVDSESAGSQSAASESRWMWSRRLDGKTVRRESVRLKDFTGMAEEKAIDERSQRLRHFTEMAEEKADEERSQRVKHFTQMAQEGDSKAVDAYPEDAWLSNPLGKMLSFSPSTPPRPLPLPPPFYYRAFLTHE